MPTNKTNENDNLLTALVSGCTAAAVSATLTYPLDFIKTQQQLNNESYMKKFNVPPNYPNSLNQLFKGGSALVLGSVFKNSTRLISYNWSSQFMAIDSHGHNSNKTTAPRIVIAGIMSAFFETLTLVPFENIKITMIQNQTFQNELNRIKDSKDITYDITGKSSHSHSQAFHAQKKPVYLRQFVSPHAYLSNDIIDQFRKNKVRFPLQSNKGSHIENLKAYYNKHPSLTFLGTIKEIYSLKGIKGFAAGTFITFTRQIAISWVWLSTYNATRQLIDPHNKENGWFNHKHTMWQSLGLHLLSSIAVITVTQPLDVIKTHVQSKNGKAIYRDSLTTAYKLFLNQGPLSLFKGSLPRFIKVLVSGGITATVYEYLEGIVNTAGGQKMFTY
ncbi:unnamed protein product [Candida verbasci]|uniref:Mitochondrial thiamine pyrophosphate carrier 1 n=1 Tax=Candida verbasci TaxID=1227364 RepID=A0A9W4X8X6_9ASCO|nr:unnamed protein product [Candida verbasci]